jgi:hypothetical protein
MASKPRWDAQVFDHRFPAHDGVVSTARAGAAAGERVAEGHVPGLDNLNSEKMAEAKKEGAVVSSDENEVHERNLEILRGATPAASSDAGLSWGQSGGVQTSHERGAETIPPSAAGSTGIMPSMVAGPSPTPSDFGRPSQPDGNHNQSWNAEQIFSGTKIG